MIRLLGTLLATLFAFIPATLPTLASSTHAVDRPEVIPISGYCLFSPSNTHVTFSPPLKTTADTVTVTLNANGSCSGTGAPSTMYLNFSAPGTWDCAGGASVGTAGARWSTSSPPASNTITAAVTGTTDSLHIELDGPGTFAAHGSFSYYPVGQTSCFTSGLSATDLEGALVFASD